MATDTDSLNPQTFKRRSGDPVAHQEGLRSVTWADPDRGRVTADLDGDLGPHRGRLGRAELGLLCRFSSPILEHAAGWLAPGARTITLPAQAGIARLLADFIVAQAWVLPGLAARKIVRLPRPAHPGHVQVRRVCPG